MTISTSEKVFIAERLRGTYYFNAYGDYYIYRDGHHIATKETRISASLYVNGIEDLDKLLK